MRLGVCQQDNTLDPDLSVAENLLVYSRYYGMPRAAAERRAGELLEFIALAAWFARSIVRPIEALTAAAHALKSADYDKATVRLRRPTIGRLRACSTS
jgi:hypothetical protein